MCLILLKPKEVFVIPISQLGKLAEQVKSLAKLLYCSHSTLGKGGFNQRVLGGPEKQNKASGRTVYQSVTWLHGKETLTQTGINSRDRIGSHDQKTQRWGEILGQLIQELRAIINDPFSFCPSILLSDVHVILKPGFPRGLAASTNPDLFLLSSGLRERISVPQPQCKASELSLDWTSTGNVTSPEPITGKGVGSLRDYKGRMDAGKEPACELESEQKCHYQDSLLHGFPPTAAVFIFSYSQSLFLPSLHLVGNPAIHRPCSPGFQRELLCSPSPAQNNTRKGEMSSFGFIIKGQGRGSQDVPAEVGYSSSLGQSTVGRQAGGHCSLCPFLDAHCIFFLGPLSQKLRN